MREILFRGKRIDNGKWVESRSMALGVSTEEPEHDTFYMLERGGSVTTRHLVMFGKKSPNAIAVACHDGCPYYSVDSKTFGQYTNMDDRNGKKVFEGDILRIYKKGDGLGTYYFPPVEYPANVVVKWDLCAWQWEVVGKERYYIHFPDAWCHYECEVIGNIYDNPELLEVE